MNLKSVIYRSAMIAGTICTTMSAANAQGYQLVTQKEISAYENTSYYATQGVILKPGFSVAANSSNDFFVRLTTYSGQNPSGGKNYVTTDNILLPGITQDGEISALSHLQRNTIFEYTDEFGRKFQTVNVKNSPTNNDVVTPYEYTATGQQPKEYLPFTINQEFAGSVVLQPVTNQANFYQAPPAGVAATNFAPYKTNIYEPSPLLRIVEAIEPRDDPWNMAIPKKSTYETFNSAGEVIRWKSYVTGFPVLDATYPANMLMVTQITDEAGKIKRAYKDLNGLIVMERVGDATEWFDTHYIYSPTGFLMFMIQPEGVTRLSSEYSIEADKQLFLDRWSFQYQYDLDGHQIAKRIPGHETGATGWTYQVYDKWNRIVLTQEPAQQPRNEYTFFKYDRFNRTIMSGLYSSTTPLSTLRSLATSSSVRHEVEAISTLGYTYLSSFPSVAENNILSVTYYDNYNFTAHADWDLEHNSYTYVNIVGYPQQIDVLASVKGYCTGSKLRVLGTNTWLNTVTYFNKDYKEIQIVAESSKGMLRKTQQYDFRGNMTLRQSHCQLLSLTVEERFEFDHAGRQINVYHKVNSQPEILMLGKKYNEVGQLVEENVHSTDFGSSFLQSIDRRYNIKGWLTHINNASLEVNPLNNDDTNDVFGMELVYYAQNLPSVSLPTFTPQNLFDSNIAFIKWSTDNKRDLPTQKLFALNYDRLGRMKEASYVTNAGSNSLPNWSGNRQFINEKVKSYDKNGNILELVRKSSVQGAKTIVDSLFYNYSISGKAGNRLVSMEDKSNNSIGFRPALASITEEYVYDKSGNVIIDHNKGITNIVYNHLGRIQEIEFTRPDLTIDLLKYTYDAAGNKISKQVMVDGTQVWRTDYVGGMQFDNDALSFIQTSQGRIINNNNTFEYEYVLKDHQDNTRVVYGPLKQTLSYRATMENPLSTMESDEFSNIAATRFMGSQFNVTRPSNDVFAPDKSAQCNAYTNKSIGPAKSIRVLNGDKVYMETFARYNQVAGNNATMAQTTLLSVLTGTFGITSGGETATLYQSFNTNLPGLSGSMTASTVVPKAYLAWIFMNDSDIYVSSGAQAITTSAYNAFEKLSRSFTANQNGNIYIFVANESNVSSAVNVYFDETYIVHEKNNTGIHVTQASDYYPFGLSFNEFNADRLLQNPDGSFRTELRNRYTFQGQEVEKDLDLGWSQFEFRMHDPALGRFASLDPLSQKYPYNTPYAFSENKLINGKELEGLEFVNTNVYTNQYNTPGAPTTFMQIIAMPFFQSYAANPNNLVTVAGQTYLYVGQDVYFDGVNYSTTGTRKNMISVEDMAGIQVRSNVKALESQPDADMVPNHTPPKYTWEVANKYSNCGGLCYGAAMARLNKAVEQTQGYSPLELDPNSTDYLMSSTRTDLLDPNTPFLGWGVGGALINNGYAYPVDNNGVWEGELQQGAAVQYWNNYPSLKAALEDNFQNGGHSGIFIDYIYDGSAITGFMMYDQYGNYHSVYMDQGRLILGANLKN